MKIFSSAQIKEWDEFTINEEPVSSLKLMERAATACFNWLSSGIFKNSKFIIFCGKGNNGGDGLAIARLLAEHTLPVSVYILGSKNPGSEDFENNLTRLHTYTDQIFFLNTAEEFPLVEKDEIIIDCLFGTGLNKPAEDMVALLIHHINLSGGIVISIDIPSGLFADRTSVGSMIVKAGYTLSFQQYKLAFLLAENEAFFGKIIVLDIGLHPKFYEEIDTPFELTDAELVKAIYKPRKAFSHKGNYGHACIVAGSYRMMGASVLATKACVKSGAGKVTSVVCKKGYDIIQSSVPEAMSKVCGKTYLKDFDNYDGYTSMGIGPGIGLHQSHKTLLQELFRQYKGTMIIDADGLNIIAENKKLLTCFPKNTIITPHPKEFEKLFGKVNNDFERMELALKKSQELKIYIVLKGHYTLVTTPYKRGYFNSTGNAGMAKGGSGDVLTGLLTGLVAQGYSCLEACLMGTYLHGLAGDFATEKNSPEAMTGSDIINNFSKAFKGLNNLYV